MASRPVYRVVLVAHAATAPEMDWDNDSISEVGADQTDALVERLEQLDFKPATVVVEQHDLPCRDTAIDIIELLEQGHVRVDEHPVRNLSPLGVKAFVGRLLGLEHDVLVVADANAVAKLICLYTPLCCTEPPGPCSGWIMERHPSGFVHTRRIGPLSCVTDQQG